LFTQAAVNGGLLLDRAPNIRRCEPVRPYVVDSEAMRALCVLSSNLRPSATFNRPRKHRLRRPREPLTTTRYHLNTIILLLVWHHPRPFARRIPRNTRFRGRFDQSSRIRSNPVESRIPVESGRSSPVAEVMLAAPFAGLGHKTREFTRCWAHTLRNTRIYEVSCSPSLRNA